jgi:hypothetical protein
MVNHFETDSWLGWLAAMLPSRGGSRQQLGVPCGHYQRAQSAGAEDTAVAAIQQPVNSPRASRTTCSCPRPSEDLPSLRVCYLRHRACLQSAQMDRRQKTWFIYYFSEWQREPVAWDATNENCGCPSKSERNHVVCWLSEMVLEI